MNREFVAGASQLLRPLEPSSQGEDVLIWSRSGNINTSLGGEVADKTLGQTYYEEAEALKAEGMKNADAVREVANKHGKTENAVRGSIYQYTSKHLDGGSTPRSRGSRKSAQSVDDLVAGARQALEQALALVDREVEEAKAVLDTAQARYDEIVAGVKDKKADIQKKLKALA